MKTEKIFTFLTLLGLLLKYINVPGGNILLVLSLLILSLLYFPFGFYFLSDKNIKTNTVTSIIFGWLLSITFISILFRIMHWPGAIVMAICGTFLSIPLVIYSYLKFQKSNSEDLNYFKKLLIRSIILSIISTLFIFFKLPF